MFDLEVSQTGQRVWLLLLQRIVPPIIQLIQFHFLTWSQKQASHFWGALVGLTLNMDPIRSEPEASPGVPAQILHPVSETSFLSCQVTRFIVPEKAMDVIRAVLMNVRGNGGEEGRCWTNVLRNWHCDVFLLSELDLLAEGCHLISLLCFKARCLLRMCCWML